MSDFDLKIGWDPRDFDVQVFQLGKKADYQVAAFGKWLDGLVANKSRTKPGAKAVAPTNPLPKAVVQAMEAMNQPKPFVTPTWRTDSGHPALNDLRKAANADGLAMAVLPWRQRTSLVLQKDVAQAVLNANVGEVKPSQVQVGRYKAAADLKVLFANLPETTTLTERAALVQAYGGEGSLLGDKVQSAYGVPREGLATQYELKAEEVQAKDGGWSTKYTLVDLSPRKRLGWQRGPKHVTTYETPSRFLKVDPDADANRAAALRHCVGVVAVELPGALLPERLELTQAEVESRAFKAALKEVQYPINAVVVGGAAGPFSSLLVLNPEAMTSLGISTLASELTVHPELAEQLAAAGSDRTGGDSSRQDKPGDGIISKNHDFDQAGQAFQPGLPADLNFKPRPIGIATADVPVEVLQEAEVEGLATPKPAVQAELPPVADNSGPAYASGSTGAPVASSTAYAHAHEAAIKHSPHVAGGVSPALLKRELVRHQLAQPIAKVAEAPVVEPEPEPSFCGAGRAGTQEDGGDSTSERPEAAKALAAEVEPDSTLPESTPTEAVEEVVVEPIAESDPEPFNHLEEVAEEFEPEPPTPSEVEETPIPEPEPVVEVEEAAAAAGPVFEAEAEIAAAPIEADEPEPAALVAGEAEVEPIAEASHEEPDLNPVVELEPPTSVSPVEVEPTPAAAVASEVEAAEPVSPVEEPVEQVQTAPAPEAEPAVSLAEVSEAPAVEPAAEVVEQAAPEAGAEPADAHPTELEQTAEVEPPAPSSLEPEAEPAVVLAEVSEAPAVEPVAEVGEQAVSEAGTESADSHPAELEQTAEVEPPAPSSLEPEAEPTVVLADVNEAPRPEVEPAAEVAESAEVAPVVNEPAAVEPTAGVEPTEPSLEPVAADAAAHPAELNQAVEVEPPAPSSLEPAPELEPEPAAEVANDPTLQPEGPQREAGEATSEPTPTATGSAPSPSLDPAAAPEAQPPEHEPEVEQPVSTVEAPEPDVEPEVEPAADAGYPEATPEMLAASAQQYESYLRYEEGAALEQGLSHEQEVNF